MYLQKVISIQNFFCWHLNKSHLMKRVGSGSECECHRSSDMVSQLGLSLSLPDPLMPMWTCSRKVSRLSLLFSHSRSKKNLIDRIRMNKNISKVVFVFWLFAGSFLRQKRISLMQGLVRNITGEKPFSANCHSRAIEPYMD
jgi:hypothetical protein